MKGGKGVGARREGAAPLLPWGSLPPGRRPNSSTYSAISRSLPTSSLSLSPLLSLSIRSCFSSCMKRLIPCQKYTRTVHKFPRFCPRQRAERQKREKETNAPNQLRHIGNNDHLAPSNQPHRQCLGHPRTKLEALLQRPSPSIPPIPPIAQPSAAHFPRRSPPSQRATRASSTRPSIPAPPMTSR